MMKWIVAFLYTLLAVIIIGTFASKKRYTNQERKLMERGHLGG